MRRLTKEMHVRMTAADSTALEAWAHEESRSASAQVVHILRQALAERAERVAPLADRTAERIRNAPREAH